MSIKSGYLVFKGNSEIINLVTTISKHVDEKGRTDLYTSKLCPGSSEQFQKVLVAPSLALTFVL